MNTLNLKAIVILLIFFLPNNINACSLYIQTLDLARKDIAENKFEKAAKAYLSLGTCEELSNEQRANALFLYSLTTLKKINNEKSAYTILKKIINNYQNTEVCADALFLLSEIELQNSRIENAKKYLHIIINEYPYHIKSRNAKILLNDIALYSKIDSLQIKVLLNKSKQMTLKSNSGFISNNFHTKQTLLIKISSSKKTILINGQDTKKQELILSSKNNIIYLNNTGYKGKIYLYTDQGQIYAVNIIDLKSYLESVVPSEMPASWHNEALKAQAVASRSYALYMMDKQAKNKFHLDATTSSQVYKGISSLSPKSSKAVEDTESQIMSLEDKPVLAVFHSNSGGFIDDPYYFWEKKYPYLKPRYDKFTPLNSWDVFFSYKELSKKIFNNKYQIKSVSINKKTPSGRVYNLSCYTNAGEIYVKGNEFRKIMGHNTVKSTLFKIQKTGLGIKVYGKGHGHGIGLSQWGAKIMAEKGYTYRQIINFYYTKDVKITKNIPRSLTRAEGNIFLTKLF